MRKSIEPKRIVPLFPKQSGRTNDFKTKEYGNAGSIQISYQSKTGIKCSRFKLDTFSLA